MTIAFDYRLIVETRWRSFMSSVHSIAYFTSRFATLAFIVLYVASNATMAPAMSQPMCQSRVTASAIFFVMSQSSIILIFLLRTMAIWNLDVRVVWPLALAWFAMVGLELTMPIKASGVIIENFCTWSINGFYVGASMTSLAVTGLLCMILTVWKLNQRGWRGILRCFLPRQTHSIDSQEVGAMLVQRTTVFVIILISIIVVADAVYFSAKLVVYQLMTISAYLAIAASLAGRIFRRSWKLTRSAYYQQPPSYFPDWADNASTGSDPGSAARPSPRRRSIDSYTFVEGEFKAGPGSSAKSLILPLREKDRTPAQLFADRHGRRPSEGTLDVPPVNMIGSNPSFDGMPPAAQSHDSTLRWQEEGQIPRRTPEPSLYERDFGISHTPELPPKLRSELANKSSNLSRANDTPGSGTGGLTRFVLPFGALEVLSGTKGRTRRPQTDPSQGNTSRRRGSANDLKQGARPATGSSAAESPQRKGVEALDEAAEAEHSEESAVDPATRDDLVRVPSRSRLWLDSSAERARMEAAASFGLTLASGDQDVKLPYASSIASSSHPSLHSAGSAGRKDLSSRRIANKRLILENASMAREGLSESERRRGDSSDGSLFDSSYTSSSRPTTSGFGQSATSKLGSPLVPGTPSSSTAGNGMRRSSFLASPAIPPGNIRTNDRSAYDFDAIRQSLSTTEQGWRPSTGDHGAMAETARTEGRWAPSTSHRLAGRQGTLSIDETLMAASGTGLHIRNIHQPLGLQGAEKQLRGVSSMQAGLRPWTAPNKDDHLAATEVRRGSEGSVLPERQHSQPQDALAAFRQVIDEDCDSSQGESLSRPRTSRGGRLGAFGQVPHDPDGGDPDDDAGAGAGALSKQSLSAFGPSAATHRRRNSSPTRCHDVRPMTSDGSLAAVRPFGWTARRAAPAEEPASEQPPGLSVIEQQYRKLAAYVDEDNGKAAQS